MQRSSILLYMNLTLAQQTVVVYRSKAEQMQDEAYMDFLSSGYALPVFGGLLLILAVVLYFKGDRRR